MLSEYFPYLSIGGGLILLAISLFYESKTEVLKKAGIKVEGIIFKQGFQTRLYGDSFDRHSVKDKIAVRFLTKNDEWITGDIQHEFGTFFWGQYEDGETVVVYYDEKNPSVFYVDTKQFPFLGRLVYAIGGVIFILAGIYRFLTGE